MTMNLSASETRVLGCLIEKHRTTPDMYPLTLNSLRLACNQSTNRDPVVDYDDETIRDALHRLERRGLTRLASGRGRSPKYRHLLSEALPMDSAEEAIVCVLMLRGPQTPGELKQRTDRMHPFTALDEVHETLERLIARGLAARLDRRPGQKEERYSQLLQDPDSDSDTAASTGEPMSDYAPATAALAHAGDSRPALEERVARLEREVAELRAALTARAGEDAPTSEDTPRGGDVPAGENATASEDASDGEQRSTDFAHSVAGEQRNEERWSS
jgi:uncharacterized protein YceH (UPF0502 family)